MTSNSKIKINLDSLKSRREWKRHKVKDGHNVFRILPPFGEASNGYPYRKWQIIWGLADLETGRMRPFASSMTSEKKCPVTEFVGELAKKAESIKSQLQAAGASDDDIKNRLKDITQLIQDLKPKTVYLYNAVDKAGEVGLLELKSTAHSFRLLFFCRSSVVFLPFFCAALNSRWMPSSAASAWPSSAG